MTSAATIVAADDNAEALYALTTLLQVEGYEVLTAENGTDSWEPIDAAASELREREAATRRIASRYRVVDGRIVEGRSSLRVAFVDATPEHGHYDRTELLLMGQERAKVAILRDGDNVTLAAAFDSGLNFLEMIGLSGGMPTLVSVPLSRLAVALDWLGVRADELPLE